MQRLYRMLPPLNLTMAVLAIAAASFASATEEASERERLEAESVPTEDRSRLDSSARLLDRPIPPRSPASAREPDDIATRLHREGRFMSGASEIAEAIGDPHRFLPGGHYSQGPLLDPEALVPLDMTPGPALRSPGSGSPEPWLPGAGEQVPWPVGSAPPDAPPGVLPAVPRD